MAKFRIIGLAKAEIGAVGADGAMGASLTDINTGIVEDSCIVSMTEAEIIKIYNEGQPDPDMVRKIRNGDVTIDFGIRDMTLANMALFLGGSVAAEKWSAETEVVSSYQSFKLTALPEEGESMEMSFPRVLVTATLDGQFNARTPGSMAVKLQVVQPYSALGVALPAITAQYI